MRLVSALLFSDAKVVANTKRQEYEQGQGQNYVYKTDEQPACQVNVTTVKVYSVHHEE